MKRLRVGIVGVGKIARDQHIPTLQASPAFELAAAASRHAEVEGVANFASVEEMLDGVRDLDAVAICTPPAAHYDAARLALAHGKHVLLEKPPCSTTAQLNQLARYAKAAGRTLFQTWHSQHAEGVGAAQQWLKARTITSAHITWKEDVRQWHPGQTWIWEAGGFGVFDPGINALSILTKIVPQPVFARSADLLVPANCEAPIAADILMFTESGAPVTAEFDFRHTGVQTWDIDIETTDGSLKLSKGGGALAINGRPVPVDDAGEYPSLYAQFAELIAGEASDVDGKPFELVADIFLLGRKLTVEPFEIR